MLGELPAWFGIEAAVENYAEVSDRSLTVVASVGTVDVGLLTLIDHGSYASEIYVMGVRPDYHRHGLGRHLLARAEELSVCRGAEYLQVKTLSEKRADRHYAATRAFYFACGFRPLEELPSLWGPDNPALLLVKRLPSLTGLDLVELRVSQLSPAAESFGWLLGALGYHPFEEWQLGRSWHRDGHYVAIEQSLAHAGKKQKRPGSVRLGFHAGEPSDVDQLVAEASHHGWRLLFPEPRPHAVGDNHYSVRLENVGGFEVELMAHPLSNRRREGALEDRALHDRGPHTRPEDVTSHRPRELSRRVKWASCRRADVSGSGGGLNRSRR